MPSDLLNNSAGVIAMRVAVEDQIRRRMRRWFKRNAVVAFEDWVDSGKTAFDMATVLGQLNVQHDEEILNLLDLLQQFEQQIINEDYNVYVDSVNGNDVTGLGTLAAPFQTLPRAQRLIPKRISSHVNVFLSGTFTEVLGEDRIITANSQLTYQGIDDPFVLDAGPYTINTWTAIGPGVCAYEIAIVGAPWIAENYKGAFVRMLDGAAAGSLFCISHNTTGTLIVGYATTVPAPGDTFEIVQPTTIINPTDFYWRINIHSENWDWPDSNFIIAGCLIPVYLHLSADSLEARFPFCSIAGLITMGGNLLINDLAWQDPTQAYVAAWTQINTNNCYIASVTGDAPNCRFSKTTIGSYYAEMINQYLYRCSIEYITQNQQPDTGLYIYTSYFHNDGTDPCIETLNGCLRLTIYRLYVEQCTDIIYAERCDIKTDQLQANVAGVSGVTLHIGANAQVSFYGVLPSPAAGDITWITTGATVAQPAVAGTNQNDANGSYVVKLS